MSPLQVWVRNTLAALQSLGYAPYIHTPYCPLQTTNTLLDPEEET